MTRRIEIEPSPLRATIAVWRGTDTTRFALGVRLMPVVSSGEGFCTSIVIALPSCAALTWMRSTVF